MDVCIRLHSLSFAKPFESKCRYFTPVYFSMSFKNKDILLSNYNIITILRKFNIV